MRVRVLPLWGLMLVPLAARAEVLPPAVADLQAKVTEAEASLAEVKSQLEDAQQRYATLDSQLHAMVELLLKAQGYPHGFWVARSVLTDQPGAAGMMRVVVRQSAEDLVATQARAARLAALYAKVNTRMERVREVRNAYADARGRLLRAEKDVLYQAGVEAEALSGVLQGSLNDRQVGLNPDEIALPEMPVLPSPTLPEAPPAWPVAGRVTRPFHTGSGAMAEGVVLKAKAGAEVRIPLGGEVLYAGPFRQFGGLVIVKTDKGDNVLLGGLSVLHVDRGNHVVSGQLIGGLGEDGLLYWEVRRNGREINPLTLVKKRS